MMDMHLGSQTGASPGDRVDPGTSAKRARARGRDERGTALVEFAVVFPLLVTLLLGIIEFGVVFSNDVALTNAASLGAQALHGRGQTLDPCMTNAAVRSTQQRPPRSGSLQFTIVLKWSPVTSAQANPSCSSSTTTTGADHPSQSPVSNNFPNSPLPSNSGVPDALVPITGIPAAPWPQA